MKNAMVIYDTSYGNTRTIAETIAETLRESGLGNQRAVERG